MEQEKEHKRRVRYKGTHPRSYREKYKELNPEKYQQDVEKIIQSGKTPAGMHIPICVNEILEFLNIQHGQIGLDATLGYGGHSRKMLEKLQGQGHLYATDVDPIESEKTRSRLEEAGYGPDILTIRRMNFAQLDEVAPGVQFDFVLADLGVSSMQIDNPERGFTFKQDGPLDLRLDPTSGEPASQRLRELNREEIAAMLVENADEPYAQEIAKAIFQKRRKHIRKPLQHISGIMIYKNIIIRIAYPAAYADHRIYSVVFIFVKVIPKFALFGFLLIFFKRRFNLHNSKIVIIIMIF